MGRDLGPMEVLEMRSTLYFDPPEKNYQVHILTVFIADLFSFSCISLMSGFEEHREYGHDNFFPGGSKQSVDRISRTPMGQRSRPIVNLCRYFSLFGLW